MTEPREEAEDWDELLTTEPAAGIPAPPVEREEVPRETVPRAPVTPAPLTPEIPAKPIRWKTREPDRGIEEYLRARPAPLPFEEPEEMERRVKEKVEEMEDWWDSWNRELDDILRE